MSRYTRILSIDGGGIRGIIPAAVLTKLEGKLQEKQGKEARVADYFDLIAGTSTGGILTCIYLCPDDTRPGRPRFSAEEALDLYMERGDEIFSIPIRHRLGSMDGVFDEKYPATGLEDALEHYFGKLELKSLLKPCLVTAYDIKHRETVFFTQQSARKAENKNYRVVDVARSTSAAPTFFECAMATSMAHTRRPLIDGGVFANNPALCAYAEARKMPHAPTAKDMVIFSIGTGEVKRSYSYDEAKDWGLISWIKPLLDIIMSGGPETVHHQLKMIYDAVEAPGQYIRLQKDDLPSASADMDNAEADNLKALRQIGMEMAETHDKALNDIVDMLLAE